MLCVPPPLGSSNFLIVITFVDVLTAVTSYSLHASPGTAVVPAEFVKNDTISPTAITLSAKSISSTAISVDPAASSPTVKDEDEITCSYAVAVAQMSTPKELPHVPAVLAAHSP